MVKLLLMCQMRFPPVIPFDGQQRPLFIPRLHNLADQAVGPQHGRLPTVKILSLDPSVQRATFGVAVEPHVVWAVVRVTRTTHKVGTQDGLLLRFTEVNLRSGRTRRIRGPKDVPDACMVIVRRSSGFVFVTPERQR